MAVSENDLVVGPLTPAAGVTTISLDFYFEQASWLEVYKAGSETTLVLNTDYTVAGAGSSSGVVTLTTAANGTDAYSIYLAVPLERSSDMQLRGEFKSGPFNVEMDRLWQSLQGLRTLLRRSVSLPRASTETAPLLPQKEVGKALAWGEDGNLVSAPITVGDIANDLIASTAARAGAEAAQEASEAARDEALDAQSASETAQGLSESAAVLSAASEGLAEGHADDAAAAAAMSGTIYADAAAGRAAVADGEFYLAVGSTSDKAVDVWRRDDASNSTLMRSYADLTAVQEIFDTLDVEDHFRAEFVFLDGDGNEVLRGNASRLEHPMLATIEETLGQTAAKVVSVSNELAGRSSFSIVDGDNNLIAEITSDEIRHPAIGGGGSDASSEVSSVRLARYYEPRDATWDSIQLLSGVSMVAVMGQSNAFGTDARPPLSTANSPWAKMYQGGVRPKDNRVTPIRDAFAALSEFENVGSNAGETAASGTAEAFAQFMLDEEGIDVTADAAALLIANHSAPGSTIEAGIASGTTAFNDMVASMDAGAALANADSLPFSVASLMLDIGESNQNNGTTQAAYVALNTTLRADLQTEAQQAGLTRPLPVYINQMNTIIPGATPAPVDGSVTPAIALAQLQLAREQDYFCLIGPSYHLPYVSLANIHYSAFGQRIKGAYLGRAMKRWQVDGVKPRPVAPLSAWKQGRFVMVKLDVQSRTPIVIDNAAFPDVDDSGIQIVDSGGTALTISSISIAWGDTLMIEVASGTPDKFRYGWIGVTSGGNLGKLQGCVRDSAGTYDIFDPTGAAYPLHNWMVACEETIQ